MVKKEKRGTRNIKNTRDGFHYNSHYWQSYKKSLPPLPGLLCDISIGMVLGDASLFKYSHHSGIKFEQGFQQKEFLFHLYNLFSNYIFMEAPGQRLDLPSKKITFFWFTFFSHYSFTTLWERFYKNGKKVIPENLIKDPCWPCLLGNVRWFLAEV